MIKKRLLTNEKEFWKWILSFLLNPSYIIRKLLYKAIYNNSQNIKGVVLDFWCWEKPYKDLFKYKKYIWVDYKSSGHDNTRNDIDIYWDWKKIPVDNELFDSFICTEVLEHVFDIDTTLNEIYRVLKKWGKWIITIPFFVWEHEIPYDFARYTYFAIEDILEKHKFKILKHERLWNSYLTLLQLNRLYISQIIYWVNNKYLIILLNILLWFPAQIIINLLSLLDLSKNQNIYLNNILVVEKI